MGNDPIALLLRLLRLYGMYAPWSTGQSRVATLMESLARRLPEGRRFVVASRDGRRFVVDARERQYWMGLLDRGVFEPAATRALSECVPKGATVVDAGANFGWYSTLLSRLVGPTGSVYAFEPMPHTASLLRENCALNGCTNVEVIEAALADAEGAATLFLRSGRACGDASMFTGTREDERVHSCRVTTLDDYFAQRRLSSCAFIKCDVEGAELLFVRGAAAVLAANRPVELIEINPVALARAGARGSSVLSELRRCGNYVFEVVDGSRNRRRVLEPADCDSIDGYVNVLCRAS